MKTTKKLILLLLSAVGCITTEAKRKKPDALLTVPQLLTRYGYPNEVHTVETSDGYLLEMHRLPQKGGKPVLLVHGLLFSSAGFVISGPNNALAYILWDRGYDVWLGNTRGNEYSRNHTHIRTNKSAFWDFSFHELGVYDVPAMVDYIIKETRFNKIHYIGHSQGSTALFVMCDQKPGYCKKIRSVNALAPAVYLNQVESPFIEFLPRFVKKNQEFSQYFFKHFGMKEFSPNKDIMQIAGQDRCQKKAVKKWLCADIAFLVFGYDSRQLRKTQVPTILQHSPAGASIKQLIHYGQLIESGKFQMFDYGFLKNHRTYGKRKPPTYNLKKVTAPVAIYYSKNDKFVATRGVEQLSNKLPNVIQLYLIRMSKFNHLDFLFGIDSKTAVYDKIVKIMNSMEI